MVGRVVSKKMKNTVVVLVEYLKIHPLYKKTYLQSKKFLADDALGVNLGDVVEIIPTKPISKNKHFKIVKVVGRDMAEVVSEQLKAQAAEIIAEVMPEEVREEEQEVSIKDKSRETEKSTVKVEKQARTRLSVKNTKSTKGGTLGKSK